MSTQAQVLDLHTPSGLAAAQGYRPFYTKNGVARIRTNRGLEVNSLLRKDEWEELDREVIQAARLRLKMAGHLVERGLVHRGGHIDRFSRFGLGDQQLHPGVQNGQRRAQFM